MEGISFFLALQVAWLSYSNLSPIYLYNRLPSIVFFLCHSPTDLVLLSCSWKAKVAVLGTHNQLLWLVWLRAQRSSAGTEFHVWPPKSTQQLVLGAYLLYKYIHMCACMHARAHYCNPKHKVLDLVLWTTPSPHCTGYNVVKTSTGGGKE